MPKAFDKPILLLYFVIFFTINCLTLLQFPVVHSDELWLIGLGESMIQEKTLWTTEAFFDLYPRVIHPFRWLFHTIQIPFILILGPTAYTARLISLIFAVGALWVFHDILARDHSSALARDLPRSLSRPFLATVVLSLNIQFLYAARFGRQETLILFLLLLLYKALTSPEVNTAYVVALILMGIGVHPNSFLMGTGTLMLLFPLLKRKKITTRAILKMIFWGFIGVLIYLFIGYLYNPQLISKYFEFGAPLGTDAPPLKRMEGFYWFWFKLYHQIGGTYDLMNIKWVLALFPVTLLFGFANQNSRPKALWLLGLLLGLFVIGRYNQTSVIFFVPWILLIAFDALEKCSKRTWLTFFVLAIALFRLHTHLSDYFEQRHYALPYDEMIEIIASHLPEDAVVLGNLNAYQAFEGRTFYDVRNLAFLRQKELTFEAYIVQRGITHIVWHEEMDYILRNQPTWDFLYTNLEYMPEVKAFLEDQTLEIITFENPIYAMRLSRYSGTYPFSTRIYQVTGPD